MRVGGAHNHRDNLGSAVMIKDNHIVAAGGIAAAIERARARAPHTSRIEVRGRLARRARRRRSPRAPTSSCSTTSRSPTCTRPSAASARSRARAHRSRSPAASPSRASPSSPRAGVDVISVGALTHSAPAADIALDLIALSDLAAPPSRARSIASAPPLGRPLAVLGRSRPRPTTTRAPPPPPAPRTAPPFVADAQTAGRGRGGRAWHSPPGENLYLSRASSARASPPPTSPPLALAVGVAVARRRGGAPSRAAAARVDQVAERRARRRAEEEARGRARRGAAPRRRGRRASSRASASTCTRPAFPDDLAARATSLALLGAEGLDRAAIAAELLAAIGGAAARYEADRLASFLPDLARLDGLRGARVEVAGVRGVAEGIDAEGRLLVRREGGAVAAVVAGEVVLDPA